MKRYDHIHTISTPAGNVRTFNLENDPLDMDNHFAKHYDERSEVSRMFRALWGPTLGDSVKVTAWRADTQEWVTMRLDVARVVTSRPACWVPYDKYWVEPPEAVRATYQLTEPEGRIKFFVSVPLREEPEA
jgi:hypothetical protein